VKLLLFIAATLACAPELGSPEWLVDRPRVLAVQAEPPEVKPGERAVYRVLAAGPQGELDAPALSWSACTAPLPLTESGSVASACFGDLPVAAQGNGVRIATASDACGRFGPIASPAVQRARQPDATGGYYQPIRARLDDALVFTLERLRCPLAQASLAVAQAFDRSYTPNRNPSVVSFSVPATIDAGASVELTVSPDAPETFPVFDVASFALVEQVETFSVSWFATAGTLEQSRTAAGENRWRAPSSPGVVYLWVVLRDSRGGVAWASAQAEVRGSR
jgi:hypothetical protein